MMATVVAEAKAPTKVVDAAVEAGAEATAMTGTVALGTCKIFLSSKQTLLY